MGEAAIKQYRLFDQALAQDASEEIDIRLRFAGADCDVVDAGTRKVHVDSRFPILSK